MILSEIFFSKWLKKTTLVLALFVFNAVYLWAQSRNPNSVNGSNTTHDSQDWIEKIIFCTLGALLGFVSSYILTILKEKKEKKELSYELSVKDVIAKKESPIKNNISIAYRNNTVPNLTFVTCTIKNTGSLLIKDEILRFEFRSSDGVKILEEYLEPIPEPELGVTKEDVGNRESFERKYKIGHLVKNKEVVFNFIVTSDNPIPTIHDYNESGDVKFNEKGLNKKRGQRERIKQFLYVNLLFIIAYPFTNSHIPRIVGADTIWAFAFLAFNLTFIKSISFILSEYFETSGRKEKINPNWEIIGNNNNITITMSEKE